MQSTCIKNLIYCISYTIVLCIGLFFFSVSARFQESLNINLRIRANFAKTSGKLPLTLTAIVFISAYFRFIVEYALFSINCQPLLCWWVNWYRPSVRTATKDSIQAQHSASEVFESKLFFSFGQIRLTNVTHRAVRARLKIHKMYRICVEILKCMQFDQAGIKSRHCARQ